MEEKEEKIIVYVPLDRFSDEHDTEINQLIDQLPEICTDEDKTSWIAREVSERLEFLFFKCLHSVFFILAVSGTMHFYFGPVPRAATFIGSENTVNRQPPIDFHPQLFARRKTEIILSLFPSITASDQDPRV